MENTYAVYILTNFKNTTFYVGITSNLVKRIYGHKNKLADGFSAKYNLNKLVYYELTNSAEAAIFREKQLKKWRKQSKIDLIEESNPDFKDLYDEIL